MKLIVLRGPSGSGKSTVARMLRDRLGSGIALVQQDQLGRTVLGRRLTDDGASAGLVDALTRAALAAAPAVLLEGILSTERYGDVLRGLRGLRDVESWFYRFELPFAVTAERHTTRDKAGSFGEDELRRWWRGSDPLLEIDGSPLEQPVDAAVSAEALVERIIAEAGLTAGDLPA
ncbi:AAA family ATPase [Leifsonia poae]|uniref:AAA family ATPase n=1 Tax=Leifsonia poae TaxID=110933 RepID=UPI003D68F9B7